MTDKAPKAPQIEFVDNPSAPEIFADEAIGAFFNNGCVRVAFASRRMDHGAEPAIPSRVVTGRLVLPVPAAIALQRLLSEFLEKIQMQTAVETSTGAPRIVQ
jgi:hypothetical protein